MEEYTQRILNGCCSASGDEPLGGVSSVGGVGAARRIHQSGSDVCTFFGRAAFATTTGIRFSIGAAFGFAAPWLAGWVYDIRGSYAIAFLGLMGISLVGAAIAAMIRAPERLLAEDSPNSKPPV